MGVLPPLRRATRAVPCGLRLSTAARRLRLTISKAAPPAGCNRRSPFAGGVEFSWRRSHADSVQYAPLQLHLGLRLATLRTTTTAVVRTQRIDKREMSLRTERVRTLVRQTLRTAVLPPPASAGVPRAATNVFVTRHQWSQASQVPGTRTPAQRLLPPPVAYRTLELVIRRERAEHGAKRDAAVRDASLLAPAMGPGAVSVRRTELAPQDLPLTPPLIHRITDQVVRTIDKRLLAQRERMGML